MFSRRKDAISIKAEQDKWQVSKDGLFSAILNYFYPLIKDNKWVIGRVTGRKNRSTSQFLHR